MKKRVPFYSLLLLLLLQFFIYPADAQKKDAPPKMRMSLQKRIPSDSVKGAMVITTDIQEWNPNETAIIICDMWQQHWCKGATARVAEMAPEINNVITIARNKGVLIVHAPSDCMNYYKDYPGRKLAQKYKSKKAQSQIISEDSLVTEKGNQWPIDQSDEGCDDFPECKQGSPWTHQIDAIQIKDNDAISDSGAEMAGLFNQKKIKNVILMGVHTNMCVIGRTFGLRNMKRLGMNVVLMRDLTDVMYDSKQWPRVSHFTGTSLMAEYIEKFVCPTMLSTDFTGQKQFRFKNDSRKVIAFITAENEYRTNQRFPEFGHELMLTRNVTCEYAVGLPIAEGAGVHNIENLQILEDADLVITCIRRRALEPEKMQLVKDYMNSGKPLLAIRTSSHAFDAKGNVSRSGGGVVASNVPVSDQLAQWPEFDKEVLGGNYQGHYGHLQKGTAITIVPGMESHPLLKGVDSLGFVSPSWLYINRPLRGENMQVLLQGTIPNEPVQPVLWVNNREKGKVVYTSLGHWDDWKIESYKNLMVNAVDYLLEKK
ncbi:isochorismatase family protein [Flavihumibacter profundi]|uniref:isochorismatase family protein n=1 Tax=Flavihumibacter profundi TaxID=2716883 RepID=UPI001CC4F8E2|nr:isochorismatase family protein [Flavihumibacter profundi]MBZ5856432.1 ThuA domain-containing protein [Flavihumibacter profundi]